MFQNYVVIRSNMYYIIWKQRDITKFNTYFKSSVPFPICNIPDGLMMIVICWNILPYHHHHLPSWIRSFDLFRHRRIAIVSWGVHDLLFLEVCSWGYVSGVWCRPFFQDGWSSFVCIWVSCLVFQRSLVLFLWLCFLFCPVPCIPLTLRRKRISAASRRVMSRFVVTHVSLP